MRTPVATLLVVAATALVFYGWSGGFLSSPGIEVAGQYGLDPKSPLTYFTYPFVHLWPLHLFANLLFVLVFGSMVELEVGARRFLLFYALSAAIVGVASVVSDLLLRAPAATVVGASGVAFALVGALLVLRPVRTIAIFLILSYLVVPVFLSGGISRAQDTAEQAAKAQILVIEQNRSETVSRFEAGNISEEEFNRTVSGMEQQRRQESERLFGLESARLRESTPVAEAAHASAPFVGALLMLLLQPSAIREWAARGQWFEKKLSRSEKYL